jgi:acetyl esterase/lipase
MTPTRYATHTLSAVAAAVFLTACGGGGEAGPGPKIDLSGARGSLVSTPVTLRSFPTGDSFQAAINNPGLFQVAGNAKCGINFNYFKYGTVGGANEPTFASGGIMVPTGTDPACQGPRPVLLYAHGTNTNQQLNMAAPSASNTEAVLVAAMYAAQGYIVVAPNYVGYELPTSGSTTNTLPYTPYLNADQSAKDMMDALAAAKKSFADIGANASSKLFVSGYSQGGHVSMATQKALQDAGTPVTAAAHLSGPYNMLKFGDAIFGGNVNAGGTLFAPLMTTSYQKAYGNIYTNTTDVYESGFANAETLLPEAPVAGVLPNTVKLRDQTKLFQVKTGLDTNPQFAPLLGTPNLIKPAYRDAYLVDAATKPTTPDNGFRKALQANTLINNNWVPNKPMLLCGGNGDPTVFYAPNTTLAKAYFDSKVPAQLTTVLDVDSAPGTNDPFATAKGGFALAKNAVITAATQQNINPTVAVAQKYHGELVPPFCNAAARGYFSQF